MRLAVSHATTGSTQARHDDEQVHRVEPVVADEVEERARLLRGPDLRQAGLCESRRGHRRADLARVSVPYTLWTSRSGCCGVPTIVTDLLIRTEK